ncbi:isochorismatase family protein [Alteromonas halophila]|uniref:Isochorismatase n=1 Tax=Alteromonas halophila TaxID=516698 RepID=A0A918JFP3_9ALTE|nr:isochorismatase family protein [Alteromonas halophila]GGW76413.1 isochorismatase [Alteromonas halophila]
MPTRYLLTEANCALMVVDVQGKLASMVADAEAVTERIVCLIKAARILNIPILWVEHCPARIGATILPVAQALEDTPCYEKASFNALATPSVASAVSQINRQHMLVCGIESHVCVYQSVAGLLAAGMQVSVLEDCVSSRKETDKAAGIRRMASMGTSVRTLEMALFEILGDARHSRFREILSLIK